MLFKIYNYISLTLRQISITLFYRGLKMVCFFPSVGTKTGQLKVSLTCLCCCSNNFVTLSLVLIVCLALLPRQNFIALFGAQYLYSTLTNH